MADSTLYPCPACGFLVFGEPLGSYEICDVCDWEDDPVQVLYPSMRGGANKDSLWEWQSRTLVQIPAHVSIFRGNNRDPSWRPLNEQDCNVSEVKSINGLSYFQAASGESFLYYWQAN